MRGDAGVAGKRESCWCTKVLFLGEVHQIVNEYQLRLDVQRFLWPVNDYIKQVFHFASWDVINIF